MSRSGTSTPRPTASTPSAIDNPDPMETPKPPLPIEEDLMQLARLGQIGAIQKLFDSGKFDATYKDEQGITPLHWAAIDNHYALCHFLIKSGADVNARGGDIGGTPLHWATRKCNYYIVNLLLQLGADPLRTDDQGFNVLQNATMDGNVFQLLLLLHHEVPVDVTDTKGHTSLMWAAYNGLPACLEVLLQWGADIHATDDQGFTALHWALVRGSYLCLQKLVEAGADRFATTTDGKSPSTIAREMNTVSQWRRALSDSGYELNGAAKYFPLQDFVKDRGLFISRVFFFWPFAILGIVIFIISGMPIYAGLPLALVVGFALQWMAQQLLRWAPIDMKTIQHTPWLSGIFAGSLFWVGVQYLRRIFPATFRIHPILNLLFIILYGLCTWFFFISMFEDPGYVPKNSSRAEQREVVQSLVAKTQFDERHFCSACMVRKPLRSKHCRRCKRCVSKHDHHCPWISNCVGTNNHRHFMMFVIVMEIGVSLVEYLTLEYLKTVPNDTTATCNVISDALCQELNKDPFTVTTMLWIMINLIWVSMLIFVQLIQISRAQTTYENMKPFESGFSDAGALATSLITAGTTNLEDAGLSSTGSGPDALATGVDPTARGPLQPAPTRPRKPENWFESWKKLLGVDTFIATAMYGSRAEEIQARNKANPFSRGCMTNCSDFFCDSESFFGRRENGSAMLGGQRVDYSAMYEPPRRDGMTARHSGAVYESVDSNEEA